MAITALSIKAAVGPLPPPAALTVHQSQVEPHLLYGCEVAVDVREHSLRPLATVQHSTFLRRALGLGNHSQPVHGNGDMASVISSSSHDPPISGIRLARNADTGSGGRP